MGYPPKKQPFLRSNNFWPQFSIWKILKKTEKNKNKKNTIFILTIFLFSFKIFLLNQFNFFIQWMRISFSSFDKLQKTEGPGTWKFFRFIKGQKRARKESQAGTWEIFCLQGTEKNTKRKATLTQPRNLQICCPLHSDLNSHKIIFPFAGNWGGQVQLGEHFVDKLFWLFERIIHQKWCVFYGVKVLWRHAISEKFVWKKTWLSDVKFEAKTCLCHARQSAAYFMTKKLVQGFHTIRLGVYRFTPNTTHVSTIRIGL